RGEGVEGEPAGAPSQREVPPERPDRRSDMKNTLKRLALSGLLAVSLTGGSLAPAVAGHAAAGGRGGLCVPPIRCPVPESVNQAGPAVAGGVSDGVLRDGSKPGGGGEGRDGRRAGIGGDPRGRSQAGVGGGSHHGGGGRAD